MAAYLLRRIRILTFLLPVLALLSSAAPCQANEQAEVDNKITIESDQQSADNTTGVVTASGNVRLVHAGRGVVATSRQAQYFSKESRIVLSGDVDVVQEDGNLIRADRVIYLLDDERAVAMPDEGGQVFSQWQLKQGEVISPPVMP